MNTSIPTLSPGVVLQNRYEIRGEIGCGGMARVYRARDVRADADVALKVLPASAPVDMHERFAREVRNAAQLEHPSCIRIADSGQCDDGSRYFAMELLSGPCLRDRIEAGPLDPTAAARVTAEILAGLEHAHAAGVLHRDLKPENVVFRARPGGGERAVLIDFGLSQGGGDARLTDTGQCVGSPSYLAPERIVGRDYGPQADLYAVGILVFEMLTGEKPFEGAGPVETAMQHLEREAPDLARARPDAPLALAAACARALRKDPDERPQRAAEMAAELAGEPAEERAGEPTSGREVPGAGAATEGAAARFASSAEAPASRAAPWWRRAARALASLFGPRRPAAPATVATSGAIGLS